MSNTDSGKIRLTSYDITNQVISSPEPIKEKYKIWSNSSYLVAQVDAQDGSDITDCGIYRGRHVIPGPMADPRLMPRLLNNDLAFIEREYFIKLTDCSTSEDAEESIGKAFFVPMSKAEIEDYESLLAKKMGYENFVPLDRSRKTDS